MRTFDLSSSYSREKFQNFLIDFLPDDYISEEKEQYYKFTNIEKGFKLGQSEELDLSIFEFQIKSKHDPRITITKEVASLMKKYEYNSNALVVFYNKTSKHWRLSLITTDYEKKDNGKPFRTYSNPKRYSFLLGEDCKEKTPHKMLFDEGKVREYTENGKKITKEQDLKNRFSLEVVGNEFFDEYKVFYEDFVQYITGNRYIKKSGKWEKTRIHKANNKIFDKFLKIANNNEELAQKYVRDYIKKMMGRLVFLHFLQKKGWLGVENNKWGTGNKNYIQELFLGSNYKDDFLEQVLEPLFFCMLNTKEDERESLFKEKHYNLDLKETFKGIPYLNGGLFESDNLDDIKIKFPKELFCNESKELKDKERVFAGETEIYPYTKYCGLLDFFSRYNFTIDESDPSDTEIGVEPEMLGKIFENLLEDNKDKGAFYTPKEIVQYMCRESLISYLLSNSKIKEEYVREFVLNHDNTENFNNEEKTFLLKKLQDVKICDPAVGSGAFPIGMLKELYMCIIALDSTKKPVDIKKNIVENNIYGVDIEKGAVDIARLRFWLAIIVDEKKPLPLPNLDFKIMQGNSLIESYKGTDLSSIVYSSKNEYEDEDLFGNHLDRQKSFNFDGEERTIELEENIAKYYNPDSQKNKHDLYKKIEKDLLNIFEHNTVPIEELKKIDLHANTEFFLWHTWFRPVFDKGGFDIVIGNPPYIKEYINKNVFTNLKSSSYYQGKMDLWYFFGCIGIDLLKENGIETYIALNNWITNSGASIFRNKVLKETQILNFIDFGNYKIFDTADNQTMIYIIKKSKKISNYFLNYQKLNKDTIDKNELNLFLLNNQDINLGIQYKLNFNNSLFFDKFITFLNPQTDKVITKIRNGNKIFLKDNEIAQGIVPNPDVVNNRNIKYLSNKNINVGEGVFVVDKDKFNKIPKIERKYLKPIYEPYLIDKYFLNSNNEKEIIYITKNNWKNDAPNLLKHLHKYKEIMEQRRENKSGQIKYFHLHWARDSRFFEKCEKILSVRKCNTPTFVFYTDIAYVMMSINVIITYRINMKYLTGLLNSRLTAYWLKKQGKMQGNNYQIDKEPLMNIPIHKPTQQQENSIVYIVDKILDLTKKENCLLNKHAQEQVNKYQLDIDKIIYKLYNLTQEEIDIVEKNL